MIYTLTLNPAIDYVMRVENFKSGEVNRAGEVSLMAGGKGINVSIMLKNLGEKSVALGVAAGFTGKEIERLLQNDGVKCDFVWLKDGNSRINAKLKVGCETEINAPGPKIEEDTVKKLYKKIDRLKKGDYLVMAGSVPKGFPETIYQDILIRLNKKEINTVVDAEGALLTETLKYQPFLIKPNHHELGELFDVEIEDKETAIKYAKELCKMGARNVLVSMSSKGAVLVTQSGEVVSGDAPKGTLVNSTGAGDSMVAGFIKGYILDGEPKTAFKYGVCAGSATAFSEGIGTGEMVEEIMMKN